MSTKHAVSVSLLPQKYAELIGRSPLRMPTALGKPSWKCSPADLRKLEEWHLEVGELVRRLEKSARAGIDFKLSPDEKVMMARHRDLQRELWRWALGVER
jgi:hypothetical protein